MTTIILHQCNVMEVQIAGKCPVRTCMWSLNGSATGCMKNIQSDFAYATLRGVSEAQVEKVKKKAVLRIQNTMLLYKYLEFIKSKEEAIGALQLKPRGNRLAFEAYIQSFPFNIHHEAIGVEWTSDRLALAMDRTVFNKFIKLSTSATKVTKIAVHEIMGMSISQYQEASVRRDNAYLTKLIRKRTKELLL